MAHSHMREQVGYKQRVHTWHGRLLSMFYVYSSLAGMEAGG